jgi:hypothetical protein
MLELSCQKYVRQKARKANNLFAFAELVGADGIEPPTYAL